MKLPNALLICQEPPTKDSLREMDTLLWLMLGAAVQCNQRVAIVEAIKTLPVEVQQAIAMKIKEVMNMHVHELSRYCQTIFAPTFAQVLQLYFYF